MKTLKSEKRGRVDYTARAFLQDAQSAMRGDIIRGLIEMITNSDDAYNGNRGKIRIEVEHCHGPWRVITRDRATGMRAARMQDAILRLGARTSGFELGQNVRGNLGRGAKDLAAFGQVQFESICDGYYSRLMLEPSGEYTLDRERKCSDEDRKRLHIPRANGTTVTVHVTENIRCPRHGKLTERLSRHYQLRDILSDSKRELMLFDIGKDIQDTLRFNCPEREAVFSGKLSVEDYPRAEVRLVVWRNAERYDDPSSDPCRPAGLLIKGNRAIYDNTLFKFEGHPYSGWFSGRVECAFIDVLAREYDERVERRERHPRDNHIPIITRTRDGLESNHPFTKVLAKSVEEVLGPLIKAEEDKAKQEGAFESSSLRKRLDAVGRDLARLIDEDLREIEADTLPIGPDGKPDVPDIKLIPEQAIAYVGEDKTLTLQVRVNLGVKDARVSLEPGGVLELLDDGPIELKSHRRRDDVLVGQVHLRPLLEGEAAFLTAEAGSHSVVALIEVLPPPEEIEEEIQPPEVLEFEREKYRLAWGKKKRLFLQAPADVVAKDGKEVRVWSDNPGIVVLGGSSVLGFDDNLEYYVSKVEIEARELGAKANLSAELGEHTATCQVIVTQDEAGPNLLIRVVPEEAGTRRALITRSGDQTVIKIMGLHPALKPYLGPPPELPGQDKPISRAIIAEIIASEGARMVVEKRFTSGSLFGEEPDAASIYVMHYRYLSKYLARCHRALVPTTEA